MNEIKSGVVSLLSTITKLAPAVGRLIAGPGGQIIGDVVALIAHKFNANADDHSDIIDKINQHPNSITILNDIESQLKQINEGNKETKKE